MTETMFPYTLHSATTIEEKDAIYGFRFDIFGREMGLLGPVENWDEPKFSDWADEYSHHVYAKSDGEVVGSIRLMRGNHCVSSSEYEETYAFKPFLDLLEPNEIAVVTRLMVGKAYRGTTLGLNMIRNIAEYCVEQEIGCVFCDCQPHLVPLYQRYGFQTYRSVFNDPYVGVMIPLVMVLGDIDHFTKVRSPFLRVFKKQKSNPVRTARINQVIGRGGEIVSEELHGSEYFQDTVSHYLTHDDSQEEDWRMLEGFTEEDISTLARGSYLLKCRKGDTIIHKNHATRTMFLVIDGLLECRVDGRSVAFVNKGDVVGEFAYLTNAPRTADIVVVSEEASVLAFEKRHMLRLIDTHPRLAARCLLNLSKSLCIKFINHAYGDRLIHRDGEGTRARFSDNGENVSGQKLE